MASGVRPTGSSARIAGSAPIVNGAPHWTHACCDGFGGLTKPHWVHCMRGMILGGTPAAPRRRTATGLRRACAPYAPPARARGTVIQHVRSALDPCARGQPSRTSTRHYPARAPGTCVAWSRAVQRLVRFMATNLRALWPVGALVAIACAAACGSGSNGAEPPAGPGSDDSGAGSTSSGGNSSGASSSGGSPACIPEGGSGPALPQAFSMLCGGCHSASGTPANPAVPNLFTYTASPQTTEAAFLAQVRAPQGGTLMPPFTTAQISDADVAQIYAYFKAGAPSQAGACPGADGGQTGNLGPCSGQTVSYTPLFPPQATPARPISYIDPTTKHLIFRGAGRVRFRHEMEDTYEIYHDH